MGRVLSIRLVQTPCLEFVHSWLCYKLKDSPNKKHTQRRKQQNKNGKVLGGPSTPKTHTHKEESNRNKHGKSLYAGRDISLWLAIHSSPVAGRLVSCCRRHRRRHRPTSPSAKCFVFFLSVFVLLCRSLWQSKMSLSYT